MNTDKTSAIALAGELAEMTKNVDASKVEIAIIPPLTFTVEVGKVKLLLSILFSSSSSSFLIIYWEKKVMGPNIKMGAQAVYTEMKGAYTGAVSFPMIKSCGVSYVLVGHSGDFFFLIFKISFIVYRMHFEHNYIIPSINRRRRITNIQI